MFFKKCVLVGNVRVLVQQKVLGSIVDLIGQNSIYFQATQTMKKTSSAEEHISNYKIYSVSCNTSPT